MAAWGKPVQSQILSGAKNVLRSAPVLTRNANCWILGPMDGVKNATKVSKNQLGPCTSKLTTCRVFACLES